VKSGHLAHCRAELAFSEADNPAMRCLPRVPDLPLRYAHMAGNTSTGGAPGRRPVCAGRLGILGGTGRRRRAEAAQKAVSVEAPDQLGLAIESCLDNSCPLAIV
jgi:hypothetical protein